MGHEEGGMTDNITRLEKALEATHSAWEAEKTMLSECIRAGYMQDNDGLRAAIQKRAEFYAKVITDIQLRIETVKRDRAANRSEVDKVALPLLHSVFPDWAVDR